MFAGTLVVLLEIPDPNVIGVGAITGLVVRPSEVAGAPAPAAVQLSSLQFTSQHNHLQQLFKWRLSLLRGNGTLPRS